MNIKRLTYNDTELIIQCDKQFLAFLESEARFDDNYIKKDNIKSFLGDLPDENKILLVAQQDNVVMGFLYGWIEKRADNKMPVAHIGFLYVDNEYRNKKIATKLTDTFLDQINQMGIKIVEVKAYNNNDIANKIYDKYGFKPIWTNYRKNI